MRKIIELFITFLKIGAFTFGGGYAMIPLIQKEVTDNKKWLEDEDILEIVAISESTPGPIAINAATFVGYRVAGFWGAMAATFGVVLPSFVIIVIISCVLKEFEHLKAVQYAFIGIRAGVTALLIKALLSMYGKCKGEVISYIVIIIAFIAVAVLGIDVIWVIIAAALIGLTASIVRRRSDDIS